MRKLGTFAKKIISIILVISCCFTSFGALISDNDGSAFITKAEFDSLKNSFQSQIDSYNSGIDNKIDGAIAAYLAGVKMSNRDTKKNILGWDRVYFKHGNLKPTYSLPVMNINFSYTFSSWATYSSQCDYKKVSMSLYGGYSTVNNMTKNLVYLTGGTEQTPTEVAWRGRTSYWNEQFDVTFLRVDHNSATFTMDTTGAKDGCQIYYIYQIKNSNTYVANLNSTDVYSPYVRPRGRDGVETSMTFTNDMAKTTLQTSVICPVDANHKLTYEHIINYDGSTTYQVSNPDFLNTLRACSSYNETNWFNSSTFTKQGFYTYNAAASNQYGAGSAQDVQFTNGTYTLRSIGTLASDWDANKIKIIDDVKKIKLKSKEYTISKTAMSQGMPFALCSKDDKVTWNVEFASVSTNAGTNKNEVDIYLSYVPFSDKLTTTDPVQLGLGETTSTYVTTKNRKAKVQWKQKKDGLVYIKCVPHFSGTGIANDWEINTDLSGTNGNYEVETDS